MFLANYGDNVTDAPLNDLIDDFRGRNELAAFLSVRPTYTFHVVEADPDGTVTALEDIRTKLRMNGGYFIIRREFFDYLEEGDELVEEPFARLDRGRPAARLRVRRVLGADGHAQGPPESSRPCTTPGRPPWAIWRSADVEPPGPPS